MRESMTDCFPESAVSGEIRLNEYQRAAVLDESPACVVNANVGSGKTTVLIEKILYLHLERNVPLERMIVLTFTNKAADEITARLLKREPGITPEQVRGFGTFHSVAMGLLKSDLPVEKAGWTKEFTVMDPDEETDLALDLIAEHGLKVKYKNRLKKRMEQEYQNWLLGKEESRYKDDLFRLYPLLEEEKKQQNKMSFADLLRVSTALLKNSRDAGGSEESRHPEWIIVDEVQDSDRMQLDFLEALRGGEKAKIFAVGDPNQVIYSWRGTGDNMFFLLKHRFGAKELTLPVNYRSNAAILEAANRFLQFGNRIQGSREAAERITVKNHYDPFQEAEYLAGRIRALHEGGKAYREVAVLYRLQHQSEILLKVFERYGVPCEVSVKKTWRDIPVLNWIVKVLRFSVNVSDVQTAVQVLTNPSYGEKCTKKKARDIVKNPESEAQYATGDQVRNAAGKGGAERLFWKMRGFERHFSGCTGDGMPSPEELFAYFELREALHPAEESYAEDERLVMDFLKKLCAVCAVRGDTAAGESGNRDFVKRVREFINSSALYGMKTDAGEKEAEGEHESADSSGKEEQPRNAVRLMTLHASKGLEFETVFLIGVNQGLIPLRCRNYEQEEEERRLFFVGITRAKDELELSWYTNPDEPGAIGEPSRYLRMIPEHLLKRADVRDEKQKMQNLRQLRREVQEQKRETQEQKREAQEQKKDEQEQLSGGRNSGQIRVRHRKYGEGVLLSEDDMMVEAEFPGYGKKQFLKAFGGVEIL